jgi:uncharacterized NAD(P)/FAD-binding protein YdhS
LRAGPAPAPAKTVAVIGGGLSGSLFALKLSRARPDYVVMVIESGRRLGRGVAYGACTPEHLLNVPVSRMEVGLSPGFAAWLQSDLAAMAVMSPALAESGGDLQAAFAPRALFGQYLQARVSEALTMGGAPGLAAVRGEAVRLRAGGGATSAMSVRLADGRDLTADIVVLATGNLPPRTPGGPDGWLYDSDVYVPDPWASDALSDVGEDDPVLLLGTGLTTVDIVLKLDAAGHRGPMLALSRRGLTPQVHAAGGAWPAFLEDALPASPLALLGLLRGQIAQARDAGVPWQRVFDAARPAVPAVWRSWSLGQKRQFLRRLRPRWDIHRHRMAPRVATRFQALVDSGRLRVAAGRIKGYAPAADGGVVATYHGPRCAEARFTARQVINCTGPRRDIALSGIPLIADLREQGLATPDPLGLGLETDDCALIEASRRPSARLFALGALTCPSWWEIVAVPEISVQVDRLVAKLAREGDLAPEDHPLAPEDFLDLGAGI